MGEVDKSTALLAKCKWTNEKVDASVLDTLLERSKLLKYQKYYFYLFSKTGFTAGCTARAVELGNVTPASYPDMVQ